jgi:23S rRNA (cytosine1962-C5)-methyltransferase
METLSLGTLTLKPTRERSLKNRHPWIFSGAVAKVTHPSSDSTLKLYKVLSDGGETLGTAYINEQCSLYGRVISWGKEDPFFSISQNVAGAIQLRKNFVLSDSTTGARLIHGEADGLPGFVADYFNGHLVVQSSTKGADGLKNIIIEEIIKNISPLSILERSHSPSRKEEGLPPAEGQLLGTTPAQVQFLEDGLTFEADLFHGQKTGFFFDHREMRRLIGSLSKGKKVLNTFSYSGGFSLHAYRGAASSVTSVDVSKEASALCAKNLSLNNMPTDGVVTADVFDYINDTSTGSYDGIVLDPPAFAKNKHSVKEALKGYYEINRKALEKIPYGVGGLLLTCSCSYNVSFEEFKTMFFSVSRDAKRKIRILQSHRIGLDHPISIYHPEGEYLKSLLVTVD